MDLTIVIVNWNAGELLLRCLQSIRDSRSSRRVHVIVVDNHSSDGSREKAAAAFPEYQVIDSGSNLGFGRGNNVARRLVDTPLILFLNPDTEVMDDTLERAAQCICDHADVGALGCKMVYPDMKVQELGLQWDTTPLTVLLELLFINRRSRKYLRSWLPRVDPLHSSYVNKLYGGFLMVRKAVLDDAGWFDERYFMYAEDADLSRTIRRLGWGLFYCADATVIHVAGGTTANVPNAFSALMKQESINKLISKYQGRRAAALHRTAVFIGSLARITVLFPMRVAAHLSRRTTSSRSLNASHFKHQQLVWWALGLNAPILPSSTHEVG